MCLALVVLVHDWSFDESFADDDVAAADVAPANTVANDTVDAAMVAALAELSYDIANNDFSNDDTWCHGPC